VEFRGGLALATKVSLCMTTMIGKLLEGYVSKSLLGITPYFARVVILYDTMCCLLWHCWLGVGKGIRHVKPHKWPL